MLGVEDSLNSAGSTNLLQIANYPLEHQHDQPLALWNNDFIIYKVHTDLRSQSYRYSLNTSLNILSKFTLLCWAILMTM